MFTKNTDKKVVSAANFEHNWSLIIPRHPSQKRDGIHGGLDDLATCDWIYFLPMRLVTIYGTTRSTSDFFNHNRKFEQPSLWESLADLRPTCTTPTYHFV